MLDSTNSKEAINDKKVLDEIIYKFKAKGITNLLLACTDLQIIIKQEDYRPGSIQGNTSRECMQ